MAQQGQPFVTNFPPLSYSSNAYNSSPQNWCIEQDISGKIVVANTSGILVYDGKDWQMIRETDEKLFYKLAKDGNGRILTGGLGDLGFLEADEQGILLYHSLLDQLDSLDRDFGRITNVVAFEGDVFFRSKSHLIRYSNGELKIWKPKENFYKLVSSSAGLFVSERSEWYQIQNNSLNLIITSPEGALPNWRAVFQGPKDTLLVITKKKGLFYLHDGSLSAIPIDIGPITIKNACEITPTKIALTTDEMGVVIIDNHGTLLEVINESMGLNGNAAIFPLYADGNLWVSMNSGISQIEYPVSVSVLNEDNGLSGFPISMTRFQDRLFLGTYEGAYWVEGDPLTTRGKFVPHENQMGQIFGLTHVGNKLVIANSEGLSVVTDLGHHYEIEIPNQVPCSALTNSMKYADVIYVSYNNSIIPIRIDNNSHQVLAEEILVPHLVYTMQELSNGDLWAAFDGISHIDFSEGFDAPRVTTLDSLSGLTEEMGYIEVSTVDGKVLFGTELGVYSYNHSTKKLIPDPIFGKQFCDGSHMAYNLTEMRNGDVWITTNNQTGLLRKQADNTFIYDSLPIIRAPISDVWEIYEDDDNVVWICGTEAVVRYDPSVEFDYHSSYRSFIRSVVVNDTKEIFAGNYSDENGFPTVVQPENYIPTLEYAENDITFKFGAAYYATDTELEFSVMLEGRDEAWSSWREAVEVNYTNLPEGEYTFKVRSRNVYGNISEESAYSFVILPPWYRTTAAYSVFVLGGLFLLWLIVKLNSRRLIREKRILEGIVTERTAEVRKQKDEIIEQSNQLQNAYQRLLELDSFKESMTSMIVHDLKNPLNAILNTVLDEVTEEQLIRIKQSGRQMLTMVLNILDVYKYENSEMEVDQEPVDMSELMKGAVEDVKYLAHEQSTEIQIHLSQSATVLGDQEVLERILVNLLTNALKYSPTMSIVELRGNIVKDRFKIEVVDHGTGIEAQYLDSVFDQFKQLKSVDSGGIRSTGLGLTFCRMATEAHQGSIGVESVHGKGSCFWLELPIMDNSTIVDVDAPMTSTAKAKLTLTAEAQSFLKPYAEELNKIPYYKISTLRKTVQEIVVPEGMTSDVNKWIQQFTEAAALANRDVINKLIQDILDEESEEL
ncbi:MAG: ATP-binding protein [Crocinitomicaceae bacterium]|nr:ATP-binding protein [Crocinitomicaceae bacterium]